ncbi:HAD hydrolase family protein [Pseudodesulfovibrio sp. zrk46]|uniref:HAD hydrolase family protein n=1 Tax=Pseudodesulfovibrio sp. zrk46 TaxID=2725288 RepID=UPI0014494974|nr:HAD hydrolase family protein [Pseudodesulfovibrio sp. zrk46]QJB56024.1 HAD hydrolase family protein [Pseudodesulfovibrio sp. zrk46]
MAVHPTVTLLVRDKEKSALFYEKSLGFSLAWETLLIGPYGQSLRLLEVPDGPTGGCIVHSVEVPSIDMAVEAIIEHGGGRGEKLLEDTPLYVGPDGELIMLSQRGLSNADVVKLVVYDFDGVMTDNRVFVDETGRETVAANRSDGLAIGMIRKLGIDQCILSTEENPVVSARAGKLNIEVSQGIRDKGSAIIDLAGRKGVSLAEVLYVGNDVNDADAMGLCGFTVAPADAHPAILAMADYVTEAPGGFGVIRELADVLSAGVRR